ncbi:MAG: zinc ribbon domain-containing protein [archaeon]|nr:zinc ribbon domain-containing protein [archaeon]
MNVGLWILVFPPLPRRYITCSKCGRHVSPSSNYCSFCGTLLRPELVLKVCASCKSRIPILARFCLECGQKQ